MHFQVSLSLWDLEVIADLFCVYCWKIFERIVTVAYLKKQQPEVICKKKVLLKISQILQETTCVGVSLQ